MKKLAVKMPPHFSICYIHETIKGIDRDKIPKQMDTNNGGRH